MKRYGNLYERITDYRNLIQAHLKARRGKAHYTDVRRINANPEPYLKSLQESLINKTYKTSPYATKKVYEPKERVIYKLPYYPDRIVHHAIMNITQPLWDKTFISDVYSAIPERGIHAGILRLRQFLRDKENTQYCLKFDISKFYPSVNHNILLSLIKKKIKCRDTLWLLEEIVRSPGGSTNIPIGNYLSQYFANICLNEFDHWLKEARRARYYIRYGDDGVILNQSRSRLVELKDEIEAYLQDNLKLKMNPKSRIVHVDSQGIDFLGYRTFRNYSLLRKSSANRLKHKVAAIVKHPEQFEPQHIISSVVSILGWLSYCNSYNLANKYIYRNRDLQSIISTAADIQGINKTNIMNLARGIR